MSDVLLTRIAEAIDGLRADLKKAAPAAARPGTTAAPATGAAANKTTPAAGAAANKAAPAAGATKPSTAAKPAAAPAGTKAPGGKHTVEEVRDMIRKVATDANLGKQSAADILDQDGGGVTKVTDLKPENYDKVWEACQVALQSEGTPAGAASAPEDELM